MNAAPLLAALLVAAVPLQAAAEERFALVVSGATGGDEYAEQYSAWTARLEAALVQRFKFKPEALTLLSESGQPDKAATAVNVRRAFASIGRRMTRDDLLLVVLIGHGTFDGLDAKFNLVGPDLESSDWASLCEPLPGRLVIVNTTSASFPFLERLTGPRRVVITATDSPAQRYDTIFAEYFIAAFDGEDADLDKNGRISIWEAFVAASGGVRRHYQQRGQLLTERALLDDNGDGVGSESTTPGEDGSRASRVYLDEALPGAAPTDEVLLKLLQRRATLTAEVDDLKIRKTFMPPEDYAREFERVMIELARVSREIRERGKSTPNPPGPPTPRQD